MCRCCKVTRTYMNVCCDGCVNEARKLTAEHWYITQVFARHEVPVDVVLIVYQMLG